MQSTKGDVAFSIDSLLEQPEKLSERGVTELYLHDEALSKDRKKIIQVLELLSQKDSPFVSILANVQTIDRELAQKAADSLCSLEIPLTASVKGEALLFDKHLFAKKALLLNEAGAVFGFSLDWGLLANDRAKLFRERLDFAIDQYPNHIDFPQLESGEIAKSTAVFSSRDMELCADLAFACQTFYSEGRAVPWFKTVLESLRIKPAAFFSDFSEWQRCNNCGRSDTSFDPYKIPHAELEKMQLLFLEQKYEEKNRSMWFSAVSDIVRINGAFSRVVAEHEDCELELSYNPDDLLSPDAYDIAHFCDTVPMENCRVSVYDAGDAPDYRLV